jgi:iron complex outermembrane receptor protein
MYADNSEARPYLPRYQTLAAQRDRSECNRNNHITSSHVATSLLCVTLLFRSSKIARDVSNCSASVTHICTLRRRAEPLTSPLVLTGLAFAFILHATSARAQDTARPLDTVTVSVASRADDAARKTESITVITRADIARTAARTLADVIALAPGVDVLSRSPASADIALRGASTEGVVILVDGVRVSDQQSGHYDLDLDVPLDAIERVEVLRGVHSALYGADAVGGVINIVTRNATHAGLSSLAVSGGSFGTASVEGSGGGTAAGTLVSGSIDAARSDGHRRGTDYRVVQARGSAERAVGTGKLRVGAGIGARDFGAADFYGPYPSFEDTRTTTGSAQWDGALNNKWSLSLGADTRRHGDLFTLYRDDPAAYQNHHVTWQSAGHLIARRTISDMLTVALGADADELHLQSARLGNRELRRGGLLSEMALGRAGGTIVDAALRVDRSSVEGTFASPSIAMSVPLTRTIALRGSAARGYRAPTWTERYYSDPANIGNPDLRIERFWAAEAGVRFTPSPRASLDAAAFVRNARDVIDWTRPAGAADSVPWQTMNVDRVNNRGVEGTVNLNNVLGDGDWSLRATGLSFDAQAAAGLEGKYALNPITRSVGLSATYPLLDARIAADAAVARRAGEAEHTIINMRMLLPSPYDRSVMLTLDLMNMTNASYLDVSGAPVPGRAAYLTVRWSGR